VEDGRTLPRTRVDVESSHHDPDATSEIVGAPDALVLSLHRFIPLRHDRYA
jgi:hypothetical protein